MAKQLSKRIKAAMGQVVESHKGVGSHGRPKRAKGINRAKPLHSRYANK